jgi:hypothetical protein
MFIKKPIVPVAAVANAGCGAGHPPTPYSVIAV